MWTRCLLAIGIASQLGVAPRPAVDPIESATVLVGAASGLSGTTFGTGFVVERRNRAYVVTCKHVISEASSTELFAIARPQKNKSPSTVLHLGRPTYHPQDRVDGTYDVAVLQIVDSSVEQLRVRGVVPLQLQPSEEAQLREGSSLMVAGYPVDYAERELASGKPDALPPMRLGGILRRVPLETLTQAGFSATLREGYFAATVERPLGKGASGSAVYLKDIGRPVRVVGVLLGSADIQVSDNRRGVRHMRGFVFASSTRALEALR